MLPSQVHPIPELSETITISKHDPHTPVNNRHLSNLQMNETLNLYSPVRAKKQLSTIEKIVTFYLYMTKIYF